MTEKTSIASSVESDDGYPELERLVACRAAHPPSGFDGPFFTTGADPDALWAAYLNHLPAARRQHYTCHCCRRFIQHFGGLLRINEGGYVESVFWTEQDMPSFFADSIMALRDIVVRARVNGVFLSSDRNLGIPRTGPWTHLSCVNPAPFKDKLRTAAQAMAEKREEYDMLGRGLAEYPLAAVEQAVRILQGDAVYRSEKALGAAQWLLALHRKIADVRGPRRDNLIWLAVATAPSGFCHVRSTVISTLLDDIVANLPMKQIQRRWAEKLHPLQYQRPSAAPKAGAIDQAEKIFAQLGLAPALARRYATLDDVLEKLWTPPPPRPPHTAGPLGGVFDHLRTPPREAVGKVTLPRTKITWEKFRRTVLPNAMALEALVPVGNGPFCALVTAVDRDAPPLLRWDGLTRRVERVVTNPVYMSTAALESGAVQELQVTEEPLPRNPVSWFFYHCNLATHWNLVGGEWAKVTAVFLSPHQWQQPEKFAHQGLHAHFALEGCWDRRDRGGLAIFPETMRKELHGVRSVIETHSQSATLSNPEQGNANGLAFAKGNANGSHVVLRVTDAGGAAEYELDRWD